MIRGEIKFKENILLEHFKKLERSYRVTDEIGDIFSFIRIINTNPLMKCSFFKFNVNRKRKRKRVLFI